MFDLSRLIKKGRQVRMISTDKSGFKQKYETFKQLLTLNDQALQIMAALEETLAGPEPFDMPFIRGRYQRLGDKIFGMIQNLNQLAPGRYEVLYQVFEAIDQMVKEDILIKKVSPIGPLVVPLDGTTQWMSGIVGGKSANLGEIKNRVKLPVPDGFAATIHACQQFIESNRLQEKINEHLGNLNVNDVTQLNRASKTIQAMIMQATIPPGVETAIRDAYRQLKKIIYPHTNISVRSSAISEDGGFTFAGQYSTLLNVSEPNLMEAYKEVIASKYNPRAIYYRYMRGYLDEDICMGVALVAMINARASGVAYTIDPNDNSNQVIMINAVWGLGKYAVNGRISQDFYILGKDRHHTVFKRKVATKKVMLTCLPDGGVKEVPVSNELQMVPCLTDDQLETLRQYALTLENHYKRPLDIEWVLDHKGQLLILQARPLQSYDFGIAERQIQTVENYPVLIEKGLRASGGIGCGDAYLVDGEEDLINFPEGAVLVTKHTSPVFVKVMRKARAILTDVGSTTGHMASLAREFRIPTIVDTHVATQLIKNGMEITVDANSVRVYEGRAEELLSSQPERKNIIEGSPVYQTLEILLRRVAPLNLLNPRDRSFKPDSCETLHDIARFCHEMAMNEMFAIGTTSFGKIGEAKKLVTSIPLNTYVIDMEGGLSEEVADLEKIGIEHITSIPFKALWRGISYKDMPWAGRKVVGFKGFLSALVHGMTEVSAYGQMVGNTIGDRNYLILSKHYMNFQLRVAYHFCTVDAYCSDNRDDNYITFRFMGGAADSIGRARRARLVYEVLRNLDFSVTRNADLVMARIVKYDRETIEKKLEMIGGLMGYTRQLDVVMQTESAVDAYIEAFMRGDYAFNLKQ